MYRLLLIVFLAMLSSAPVKGSTERMRNFNEYQNLTWNTSVDVVFLIQCSGPSEQFYLQKKKLVYWLTRYHMNIHPGYAQVSIVTYSDEAAVSMNSFNKLMNKAQTLQTIKHKLIYKHSLAKGNKISVGLEKVSKLFVWRSRQSAKRLLFVLTDGTHNDKPDRQFLNKLKTDLDGIYVVCFMAWCTSKAAELASETSYSAPVTKWMRTTMAVKSGLGLFKESSSWAPHPDGCAGSCGQGTSCYCDGVTGTEKCFCPPGYHPNTGGKCTACVSGGYKSLPGNHSCAVCPGFVDSTPDRTDCQCGRDPYPDCQGPCAPNPCGPHQMCVDFGQRYECWCEPGWKGPECTKNDNDCQNSKCPTGSRCIDAVNSYVCLCDWSRDGALCMQIFTTCGPDACPPGHQCKNEGETYKCTCTTDNCDVDSSESESSESSEEETPVESTVSNPTVTGKRQNRTAPISTVTPYTSRSSTKTTKTEKGHDENSVNGEEYGLQNYMYFAIGIGAAFCLGMICLVAFLVSKKTQLSAASGGHDTTYHVHPVIVMSEPHYLPEDGPHRGSGTSALKPGESAPPLPDGFAEVVRADHQPRDTSYPNMVMNHGMKDWTPYIQSLLEDNRIMDIYVSNFDHAKYISSSSEFMLGKRTIADLFNIMMSNAHNITLNLTPHHQVTILTNQESALSGCGMYTGSTGSVPIIFSAQMSREHVIIATGERDYDDGQCEVEVSYLRSHFVNLEF